MRKYFSFILILFLIGFISASYVCSTDFDEDKKEINVLESSSVNGLEIGVINSYSSAAGGGIYYANLMIDGESFVLTDEINESEFEIQNGEDIIKLVNVSGNTVNIQIDGESKDIGVDESASFGNYIVYITDVQGVYPGDAQVGGFVGQEKINLNKDEKEKKVTVEETDYIVELFSATNDNIIIVIKKCDNGTISYFEEENETINDTLNETGVEINNIESQNDFNETNQTETNNTEGINESFNEDEKSLYYNLFIYGLIIALIVVIVLIIFFWSISKRKEKTEEEKIGAPDPSKNPEQEREENANI